MGLSTEFVFYLVTMGILGILMPMFNTPSVVILQETTSQEMQGRVFSIVSIIGGGVMPLSMVMYGPLADIIKVEHLIIITGILFTLVSMLLMYDKKLKYEKVKEQVMADVE